MTVVPGGIVYKFDMIEHYWAFLVLDFEYMRRPREEAKRACMSYY